VADLFTPTGAMRDPRFKFDDAIAMLPDGDVVVGGAGQTAEVYHLAAGAFTVADGDMGAERFFATATTLPNGSVLIAGGYDANIQTTAQAWIYK